MIVVRGYGAWSGVNYLPTLGYTSAVELPPETIGVEMALNNSRPHYRLSSVKVHYAFTHHAVHYRVNEGR
jgi:hypothetical protein